MEVVGCKATYLLEAPPAFSFFARLPLCYGHIAAVNIKPETEHTMHL